MEHLILQAWFESQSAVLLLVCTTLALATLIVGADWLVEGADWPVEGAAGRLGAA
jgi:hypothetical protein